MGQWKAFKKTSGTGWKELEREAGTGWKALLYETAYEDFTTYTEVDPQSKITKTATQISFADLVRNASACYVYKDFGVDYFNGFNIEYEMYLDSSSTATAHTGPGLSTTVNPMNAAPATSVWVTLARVDASTWRTNLLRGPWAAGIYYAISSDTTYYCRLEREAASDSISNHIYSDAARTNLLNTRTLTGFGTATRFRYLYGVNGWYSVYTGMNTGHIKNMEIK